MSFDFRQASFNRLQLDIQETDLIKELFRVRSQKNKSIPISSLPLEVLTKIFLLCRNHHAHLGFDCRESSNNTRSGYTSAVDEWKDKHKMCQSFGFCAEDSILVVLSRVCSSWYTFVLSTPIFWDTVWLHHPLFVLQRRAPLRRDIPVIVKCYSKGSFCCGEPYKIPDPVIAMDWLLTTCPRIRAIDLTLPFISIKNILLLLSTRPPNLEGLRRLSLYESDHISFRNAAGGGPSDWGQPQSYRPLMSLSLSSLSLKTLRYPSWLYSTSLSRLRCLTLDCPIITLDALHNLIRVLVACSSWLQDTSLSFATWTINSYHEYLSPQTAQSLTDCLASHPFIHFAKLRTLEIHCWGGYLIHALLNLFDAPQSACKVYLKAVSDLWDYLDAKPMTAEWGSAIGNYDLSSGPMMKFAPSRSSNDLTISSIRFPIIIFNRDDRSISLRSTTFDIVRMAVTLQGFVNITKLVLDIVTFNKTYSVKTDSDLDNANRSEETFLHEYALTNHLYSLETEEQLHDHKEYDCLVGLLGLIPSIQLLRLTGLTGMKYNDQYLGRVLSVPSPSEVARNAICPRLESLVLDYDARSPKVEQEMYLVWVYQVLLSRQRASVVGSAQAITQVEVLLCASHSQYTQEYGITPDQRKAYDKVNTQVQRMKATLGSSVAVSARFYREEPVASFLYRPERTHAFK